MKIAIDIRTAGGEKAGKGWYTFHVVRNLLRLEQKRNSKNQYVLYSQSGIPGFEEFKNATQKQINSGGLSWHRKVAKDCKNEGVNIFFAPSSYITPTLLPKNIKSIVTVHDLVAFLFPDTHNKKAVFIEKLCLKKALKKSAHILTVSKNTKKDLLHKFKKLPEEKISVTYCSASDDFKPLPQGQLQQFAKETNLPKKFFLAVGTILPRKNYLNLIRAFSIFKEKHPEYHLIVVGDNGWDYEPVYEAIKNNYLSKKVHVLGYLSGKSLVCLYNLAQALVFPSLYEGFGIPPLEAMKCGCPVIASYTSSIPEVVGDSALLINPEKPQEIAHAMHKIAVDEELSEKLKSLGFAQSKKFSWHFSAEALQEIIDNIDY